MLSAAAAEVDAYSSSLWTQVEAFPVAARDVSYLHLTDFTKLTMDESAMRQTLDAAPDEAALNFSISTDTLTLVDPDGNLQRFAIYETAVMAPELAAQFPDIKTYAGEGIDDPTARVQLDLTPQGFHAQVLSEHGRWYIDPYFHLSDDFYASYYASAALPSESMLSLSESDAAGNDAIQTASHRHDRWSCCTECALPIPVAQINTANRSAESVARSGTELRTYRAAVAASGEYTAFHGGTVTAGQAAIVTAINRVTGIYENELSIRLQLVGNNSSLVYTNAATDPYTNNDANALLTENQSNIDSVIGTANYDIGHVFTTGGGGLAGLGVVGSSSQKAWGETGSSSPIGDPFYVDYVSHEMGHQFGANHTFNVPDSNRNASTAYEPGSGSTIMAYAGLFGADDLQSNSDPYFHSVSFDEIISFVDNTIPSVGTRTATGNSVPTVNAGSDYTIPASTPFTLTAVGSDANGSDVLTYNWEERDLGPAQSLSDPDNGSSPLFRSFTPTTSPSRTFPKLSSILSNTSSVGEKLPTTTRAMNFRAIVRDNRSGGGGVNTDDMVVNVVNTGAAFAVTSQNSATSLTGGSSQTVTWNVAGTTANGINTANVRILLSTDGGNTFGTVLASSTPNDGSQSITLPNTATTQARIKIEAVGNIFFDVNNANFTITASANQNPVVDNQSFNLNENSPNGTVVGTVAASDPDAGQTLTYAITGGNTSSAFAINSSTGQITVANSSAVNFEVNPTFNLTVQVTDNGSPNLSDTATITINLTNINEAPSLSLSPTSANIDENTSTTGGLNVSTITVIDDALGAETLSLTGADASFFEIVGSNLRIKSGTALNFEVKDNYSVTVNINDPTVGGNPDASQSFVLFLNDLEEPPVIANQSFNVATGAGNGTVVGTVAASDPEGTALAYQILSGNTSGAFAINASTGQLTVANSAAIISGNSPFSLVVEVQDGSFNTSTATITVSVNTAPTIGGAVANQPVNDTATIAPFSSMTITDPDTQAMSAIVRINNGAVRGDFTSASAAGWSRTVSGNNIQYSRTFSSAANIGSVAQAAVRGLVFDPRENAIKPNTTEATTFNVTVTDGIATPVTNTTTSVITTSVNNAPAISGANPSVTVNDNATVGPFSSLVVSDSDFQEGLAKITIFNGAFRGDFSNAISNGWTRSTTGNNINYVRYFSPVAGIGPTVQTALRALVFQPRQNAIKPGTTEATDFLVSMSDGVASPAVDQNTRVTTTSVNNAPTISGAVAGQTMNDNQTKAVFSTLTITDPDTQDMLVRVTIPNGVNRGDFTSASTAGWTRTVNGIDIIYNRYFSQTANVGSAVQTAVRALVFQPRTNVPIGTTETTGFTVFVNDGVANTTNSTTSVITTGVAPRVAASFTILDSDVSMVALPTRAAATVNSVVVSKKNVTLLSRLFKRG